VKTTRVAVGALQVGGIEDTQELAIGTGTFSTDVFEVT
jgi:hypothetical protein